MDVAMVFCSLSEILTYQIIHFRTQFNPDEQWTKALKYLLSNIKWTITLDSALEPPRLSSSMASRH